MAKYKGVEIDAGVHPFIASMPQVDEYREVLQSLQAVWDNLNLLGQLSGTTAEMGETREAFADLTGELLSNLAERVLAKRQQSMAAKSQVVIDVLVRNLFERTADIGFLATDGEIRDFAEHPDNPGAIEARFREYVAKYSVYDDVILLDPQGRIQARLDHGQHVESVEEDWLRRALDANDYVEYFGPTRLGERPNQPVLIYASRVLSARGRVLGVLALRFRFQDEMQRIFAKLTSDHVAMVLALLDANGEVIASSDQWQLPIGAPIQHTPGTLTRSRFAGRHFLVRASQSNGYQGYAGPGWTGVALLPLDQAFSEEDGTLGEMNAQLMDAVLSSELAFPARLRAIPAKAGAIQRNLARSVWNGTVRSNALNAAVNPAFSKILLREISRTGMRMREVFSTSIRNLQATVVSSQLDECAFLAELAVDIMDRNLYERANDCRWWALDPVLVRGLASPDKLGAADEMGRVLAYINSLYTVYATLVAFDTTGRIVAVSRNEDAAGWLGQVLEASWVSECLQLKNSQAYSVSSFERHALYGGKPTYIYASAVRDPRNHQVIGGIGIVFDSAPQFSTMLQDVLPRDASGHVLPGSEVIFMNDQGLIIASSSAERLPGEMFDSAFMSRVNSRERGSELILHGQQVFALGWRRSTGYREYKGPEDAYRNDLSAVVLVPLGSVADSRHDTEPGVSRRRQPIGTGGAEIEIASFRLGDHWLGLPVVDVVEAIELREIARIPNAPPQIFGAAMYQGESLPLYNLHAALGVTQSGSDVWQIVVVKGESGALFGVLVDALDEVLEVPLTAISDVSSIYIGMTPVLASVVRGSEPGEPMLTLLSASSMTRKLNA